MRTLIQAYYSSFLNFTWHEPGSKVAPETGNLNGAVEGSLSALNNKRKLEEDTKVGTLALKKPRTYIKHDVYWLLDGNVLLQIGKIRFKLHMSRLANESPWFQSLFERRAGFLQGNDFQDQEEIDKAASTVEVVDGYDLFYLSDLPDAPEASDFAELLWCMDSAITYLKEEPTFPTINSILGAAYFFRFDSYATALKHIILKNFPDEPEKIGATITPHADGALFLGRNSSDLKGIIRCAFYQLARHPPNSTVSGSTSLVEALETLSKEDLILLLKVQKELALAWEFIIPIVEPTCDGSMCDINPTPNTGSAITGRKKYLFDPVFRISKLIGQDWSSKGFCPAKEKEAIIKLKAERSKIWANLKTWLELEN